MSWENILLLAIPELIKLISQAISGDVVAARRVAQILPNSAEAILDAAAAAAADRLKIPKAKRK